LNNLGFDSGIDGLYDDAKLINLTAMWKASGSVENQDPRQWRRKEGKSFIAHIAKSLDVPVGHIAKATNLFRLLVGSDGG
jgi:hypothetical protein